MFVVWAFRLIVHLSIMWLRRRCAACQSLRLTMDMAWETRNCRHKTARARIRLLLFESKSRWLSTVYLCSEELSGWGTGVVHLEQNCWELEWEGITINYRARSCPPCLWQIYKANNKYKYKAIYVHKLKTPVNTWETLKRNVFDCFWLLHSKTSAITRNGTALQGKDYRMGLTFRGTKLSPFGPAIDPRL